jgi:hypothetical protein
LEFVAGHATSSEFLNKAGDEEGRGRRRWWAITHRREDGVEVPGGRPGTERRE